MEKCLIHRLKVLLLLWCHFFPKHLNWCNSFPGGTVVENPPASAGHAGLTPGSRRSPGVENGNLLQYSCLESSMDRGAWQTIVHGVTKGQTGPHDRAYTQSQSKSQYAFFFFFGRNWQADSKIQKNSENNFDKEEQSWRVNATGFQDVY